MMTNAETVAERKNLPAVVLVPAPVEPTPEATLQELADQITQDIGQAVEKILAIGRRLLATRKTLKHGDWERLFKGHSRAVANPVPFSVKTALMYMKIAEHPILSNSNLGYCLPPSWRTLYVLSLLPDACIAALLQKGQITPETTRRQIECLHENYELEQHGGDPDWRWKEEWQSMPEYVTADHSPHQTIRLHFASEADVQAFAQLVGQKITEKTKYLWFHQLKRQSPIYRVDRETFRQLANVLENSVRQRDKTR